MIQIRLREAYPGGTRGESEYEGWGEEEEQEERNMRRGRGCVRFKAAMRGYGENLKTDSESYDSCL